MCDQLLSLIALSSIVLDQCDVMSTGFCFQSTHRYSWRTGCVA